MLAGELRLALDLGWEPSEISYTGTNLSERDLDAVLGTGVHLNVDLLTQLERVGRRAPGATVGSGSTHGRGAIRGGDQTYSGDRPTKFGIYPEGPRDALAIARRHGLVIDTVHVHAGYLYLTDALPQVDETMRRVAAATRQLQEAGCPIVEVNTGGGLGVPFRPGDRPLDLDAWAGVLATHLDLSVWWSAPSRGVPGQGVRRPSRRGRECRGPGRHDVRRSRHRMERDRRALRVPDSVPSGP